MLTDDSTDEELEVNRQLGERLPINKEPHSNYHNTRDERPSNSKEHKENRNGRDKHRCNSSHSTKVNAHRPESASVNRKFVPETTRPHQLGNKKRQNKDRNDEETAKSKRTCFNVYPECKEAKIRNLHCTDPQNCTSMTRDCSRVTETSVRAEPPAIASTSAANSYGRVNSGVEHLQKDISSHEKDRDFMKNAPFFSEIHGTNSSSNFSGADLLHSNSKRHGSSALKSYDACLSFPSTLSSGQSFTDTTQNSASRVTRGRPHGVQYSDSESDENNRLYAKRGALKGERQFMRLPWDTSSDESDHFNFDRYINRRHQSKVAHKSKKSSRHQSKVAHKSKKSSRPRKGLHSKSVNKHFPSFDCSTSGPAGQSKLHSRHHRSGSPRPRSLGHRRHSRGLSRTSSDKSKHSSNKSSTKTVLRKEFDHENRSEVEFQSANSYSGNGVSESFGRIENGSAFRASCSGVRTEDGRGREHGISGESSEEEVSVIFIASPRSRDGSNSKRHQHGGTARRRHSSVPSRGSRSHDRVSVSPDPVEQARQIKDDERLARLLQAKFDAEVDKKEYRPEAHHHHHHTMGRIYDESFQSRNAATDHHQHPSMGRIYDESFQSRNVAADHHHHHSMGRIYDESFQSRNAAADHHHYHSMGRTYDESFQSRNAAADHHHHHHHHHSMGRIYDESFQSRNAAADHHRHHSMGRIYDEFFQSRNAAAYHYHPHHAIYHSPTFSSTALHRGRGRSRPRLADFSAVNNGSGRGRHVRRDMHGGITEGPWISHLARTLTNRWFDAVRANYESMLEPAEDVGEAVPRGLNNSEINRLPTRKYNNNIASSDAASSKDFDETVHKRTELKKECQICLCDYENGDALRILPCFHEFHTACIDRWLNINCTCPVCRAEVDLDKI